MAWTWRYETASGGAVEGEALPRSPFPTQGEAESWLGETWRTLLDQGVDQVTLLEDGERVYGPMSLHPAS